MAATSLDLLLLAQRYRGDLIPQVNRKAVTLGALMADEDSGKNCAWGFRLAGKTARALTEGADAATPDQDVQAPATLSWGLYDFTMAVTNTAAAAAASSGGDPDVNNDVWLEQIQEGLETMSSLINVDLYQGDGSGSSSELTIVGFGEVFGSTTNTYAGRDRSQAVNAPIRPTVIDPGTPTAFTIKMFRDDLAKIYRLCGERPPLAFCQPLLFNMIASRFDNIRRIEIGEQISTGRGIITLDGSAQAIVVDGCTVMEDKDAVYSGETDSVGSLTYVNPKYTRLKVLPPASLENAEVKKRYSLNDGFDNIALNVKYEMLARFGSSTRARGELHLQLQCKRPNSGGIRKNILIA